MNKLSWVLYWADVLPSVARVVGVLSGVGILIAGFCSAVHLIAKVDKEDYENELKLAPKFLGLFLFLAVAVNLIPAKETFYLIAASEAGEQAIQTPEFSKVRAVINNYLDDQLDTEKEGDNTHD